LPWHLAHGVSWSSHQHDFIAGGNSPAWPGQVLGPHQGQVHRDQVPCLPICPGLVQSDDLTAHSIAFETIGYIGVSLEGKTALVEKGNKMVECIEKLEMLIRDRPIEVKIRAMNALASLIKLDNVYQSAELLSLTQAWYMRTGLILCEDEKCPWPFASNLGDRVVVEMKQEKENKKEKLVSS
jgi:hypothetical protein